MELQAMRWQGMRLSEPARETELDRKTVRKIDPIGGPGG